MPAKTPWRMKGSYIKSCNCIASCPCDTTGYPYPGPGCEGMAGMEIAKGHYGRIPLSGLRWAAIYRWPGALHEGNGSILPLVDERADEAQRGALLQILSGKAGGTFFEILASVVTTLHEPRFVPIRFSFDKRKRRARVSIPGVLETVAGPLKVPATGETQRVTVCIPGGFEYKEMEVASAALLKARGPIRFLFRNRHASLARVEHTHRGLVG